MDHLFNDFKQKGIHAFRDDREFPKGEEISSHLYKAIEESRFLIIIFSKNYASSSWCLRELVKILERKQIENPKHEVRIIFYDAKPDAARKQKRSYAEAFREHEISNSTEVGKWKEALSMAADLSGFDLQEMTYRYEYKFIDCISKDILKKLCDGPLHIGENIVGIDFHFDRLGLSRFVGSDKEVASCFCEDVKEVTKRQDLIQVQRHMIGQSMKLEDLNIPSVAKGAAIIKQRMACKPILLVLDDVDDHKQLEALAGSASWFFPGSLIIFTCKDKQLLRSHRVDEIHDMYFLNEDQSLELLRSYAFKEKESSRDLEEAAEKVVKYVQGHPLALKVLGRFLYGKTVGQWVSELDQLKVHPNKKIQQVLRLSYDGLNLHQQNILLDIACSFIGVNRDFAASVLDGCNFFADTNIQVLVDKSLITISGDMSLQMHDLIQAMVREIIHEESIMTGKQRRLWNPSEAYNVLSEKKVEITQVVEVLVLSLEKFSQKVHIDANDFAHMKKLRILKIYQQEDHGWYEKLELTSHNTAPCLKSFPSNLEMDSLRILILSGCLKLDKLPEDLGRIKSLTELHADRTAITEVPSFVSSLINLESLSFGGQGRIQPKWWTSITTPFGLLSKQQHPPRSLSLAGLHMLKDLNLSYCNLVQVPDGLGGLSCLKYLDLKGNNFTSFPGSLSQLSHLNTLDLDGCKKLEVLRELPHYLKYIFARDCSSLCSITRSSKDPIMSKSSTYLSNSPKLFTNLAIDSYASISET
ncbi:NB-ARC domains-containing protein [Tanacetum coccineum]